MTFPFIIGITASVLTAVSMIPQLIKLIREKKAGDVSLFMLGILFAGLGLWAWYGFLKNDWIIIISNGFSFVINVLLAYFTLKYKSRSHEKG